MTELLRCPHCHAPLDRVGAAWRCDAGHSFDVAKQGYVNLLPGPSPHAGDATEMLEARAATLAAGHLDAVTDALVSALADGLADGALVEVGAGTAHHLARVMAATGRPGVAMDVSKGAARRAARAHPDILSVVADAWQPWPVRDRVVACVLHVFAPRNDDEAHRVLAPGGRLVVTTPAPDHLHELVEALGLIGTAPAATKLPSHPGLVAGSTHPARARRTLTRDEVRAVVTMGPNAHHLDPTELERRLADLDDAVEVTVAVDVHTFRRA